MAGHPAAERFGKAMSSSHDRKPASQGIKLVAVLIVAAVVRLSLFATQPGLIATLQDRIELNDPSTSWKTMLKAHQTLAYPKQQVISSIYDGAGHDDLQQGSIGDVGTAAAVTQRATATPLLLSIVGPFLVADGSTQGVSLGTSFFFTAMDLISAFSIFQIASLRLRSPIAADVATSRQIGRRLSARRLFNIVHGLRQSPSPVWASAVFVLNPLTTMTCLSLGGGVITTPLTLLSTWAAMAGRPIVAAVGISLAGAISFHPLLLLPAIWILGVNQARFWRHNTGRRIGKRKSDSIFDWIKPIVASAASLGLLAGFSAAFIADANGYVRGGNYDWRGLLELYQGFVLLPSLTPSLSLWWYFFVEIFDHFRDFFLLVFNVHLFLWVVPICIRFRHDALFALFLLLGVQSIFKPHPTIGDVSLYLSLSTLFPAQASYLRTPLPTALMYLYSALLFPLFAHLFLKLGSANANFLYAAGLICSLGGILGWIDWAWAGGRYLWELEREAGLDEILEEDEVLEAKAGQHTTRTVMQL